MTRRKGELGTLARLSAPLMLSTSIFILMELIDAVMLGNYAPLSLAALTWCASLLFVIFLPSAGIFSALTAQAAKSNGAQQPQNLAPFHDMGRIFALACGAVSIALLLGIAWAWPVFGLAPDLGGEVARYLWVFTCATFPMMLFQAHRALLSAAERTKIITIAVALAALVNIIANFILIFGRFGMPEMGIMGAALGTSLAYLAAFGVFEVHISRWCRDLSLLHGWPKLDGPAMLRLLWLGGPISVVLFVETGLYYALTLLVGTYGTLALAAHGIAFQTVCIFYGIYGGLHQGVIPFIAASAGREALHRRQRLVLKSAWGLTLLGSLLTVAFPEWIILLFTANLPQADVADLRPMLLSLLLIAAVFLSVDCLDGTLGAICAGIEKTWVPMWIKIVTSWGIAFPLSFWLGSYAEYGVKGIWSGWTIGTAFCALGSYAYLKFLKREV